ncbi:MAG: hypothetical protein B7Z44_13055 [Caulobacter sp. 12-67-6]|nr:MAG: hypothetical protein B7Z44_13055 [Caulobacter sp. 12-67-6]OYX71480.1 MAG: hypothetical protein B7Y81_09045 [Caulobacter sp. 32-67-35]OYX96982.1 MAG: hypothetical protein B7Y78_02635 [Caulobacter sp. 35-67-4]
MSAAYHVQADWDPDAGVWISSSNIPGLVVEAETLAEFVELVQALAPQLLAENLGLAGRVPIDLRAKGTLDLAVAS